MKGIWGSLNGSKSPNFAGVRGGRFAEQLAPLARAAFGPILLAALTVAWFYPIRQGAIGFDDVGAVLRWTDPQVGLLDRTILDVTANRWRPVFTSLFTLMTGAMGENYAAYFWFNVAVTLALVLLVYRLVLRLSSSAILATAIAYIVVTSRFDGAHRMSPGLLIESPHPVTVSA